MGDLLIATLAMPAGQSPDWDAAKNKVADLSAERMEAILGQMYGDTPDECFTLEGELDLGACAAEIISLVDDVRVACESEHRHLYASDYIVPGWRVWITGGDSWDDLAEEWDLFVSFIEAHELAEAAGFATKFVEPTAA